MVLPPMAECGTGPDVLYPDVVWSVTSFGGTAGTPFVDEDIVVSADAFSNRVFAVARDDGHLLWQTMLDLPTSAIEGGSVSPNLEVRAIGDLLLVASGWLYALDRTTGQLRWSFAPADDRPGRWVVLDDDRVIAGNRLIYIIDPLTGSVLDDVDVGEYAFAPVVDDHVLYFGARAPGTPSGGLVPLGEGHATALDLMSLQVLWTHLIPDHPTLSWVGGATARGALTEDLFVIAGLNARVYGLDRQTGEERWMHEGPSPYNAQVAIIDDVAIVGGTNGTVEGLDAADGEVRWTDVATSSISRLGSTPDFALPSNGRIRAFDEDGASGWGFGGAGWGQPTFSTTPVVWGDRLYANSVESGLFAIEFLLSSP